MAYKRGPSREGIAKARKQTREERFRRIEQMRENTIRRMNKKRDNLPGGFLTGGQAKLDKNKNNKIDAQDFKILRAEKAKGREQGLQDEKMKPGRTMRAALGAMVLGMGAKKRMDKKKMVPGAIGGVGASMARLNAMKKILGMKMGGKIIKADKGKIIRKDPTKAINRVGVKDRYGMPIKPKTSQLGKDLAYQAAKAAKATRLGKIAAGVAGVALAAKAGLEKMYEKKTGKKPFTKRPGRVMKGDVEGSIKPFVKKKMGGGMMMRKPMGGGYMGGGLTEATQRLKAQGKMGGGMMMRPNPVGMKSGKSVKVKCKLGRNKPTKMY